MGFFKNVKDTVTVSTLGTAKVTKSYVQSTVAAADALSTIPFLAMAKDEVSAEELRALFAGMNSEDVITGINARELAIFLACFGKEGCRDLGLLK